MIASAESANDRTNSLWGEAAIYLSLDLADAIVPFLGLRSDYLEIKAANRLAIHKNRMMMDATGSHPSSGLKQLVDEAFALKRWQFLDYSEFVESRFVGAASGKNTAYADAVRMLGTLNFIPETRAKAVNIVGKDALIELNNAFDDKRMHEIVKALFSIDKIVDAELYSDWDRALLKRHEAWLGHCNQLSPLAQVAVDLLIDEAVTKFRSRVGQEAFNQLRGLIA